MNLYHKILKSSDYVTQALSGSFTLPKVSEILLLKTDHLTLIEIDDDTLKPKIVIEQQVYSKIKKGCSFRFIGSKIDHIILVTDSGKLVVLEANREKCCFNVVSEMVISKSGYRLYGPSEFLANEIKGRAIMIASIEKVKYSFNFTIDSLTKEIVTSSPKEININNCICFDLISVDNGYNNPLFCSLESYIDYNSDENTVYTGVINKQITIYEMDLNSNHVIKKFSFKTMSCANKLIPISISKSVKKQNLIETDELIGVLICCDGFLIFVNFTNIGSSLISEKNIFEESKVAILPIRKESKFYKPIITGHINFKFEEELIYVLQTDIGDLFSVKFEFVNSQLINFEIHYFDSIPPCMSICVSRNGVIYAATDSSNE